MKPLLRLESVVKRYGEITVLNGVNLLVNPGSVVAVVGRSGTGKTSLARIAALVDRPDSGRVIVDGVDALRLGDGGRAALRLHLIGYIDQHYTLIPTLTALENAELPLALMGVPRSERRRRVLELFEELGLKGKEDRLPGQLSGGERQRVAIARALAKKPKLIVADEPASSLDEETARTVYAMLAREARERGAAVLITLTSLEPGLKADIVYTISGGRLRAVDG